MTVSLPDIGDDLLLVMDALAPILTCGDMILYDTFVSTDDPDDTRVISIKIPKGNAICSIDNCQWSCTRGELPFALITKGRSLQ